MREWEEGREVGRELYASWASARSCVVWWCGAAFAALAHVVNTRCGAGGGTQLPALCDRDHRQPCSVFPFRFHKSHPLGFGVPSLPPPSGQPRVPAVAQCSASRETPLREVWCTARRCVARGSGVRAALPAAPIDLTGLLPVAPRQRARHARCFNKLTHKTRHCP